MGNVYCFVFKTGRQLYQYKFLIQAIADNETRFLKGCLDYGIEPTDFLAAWPEDQACMTITDGEIKGIPSGHGCKCSQDNCNYDICTAAEANNEDSYEGKDLVADLDDEK